MVYQGSKARLRKYILPIIQECIDKNNIETYIEPFVGGANLIDHVICKNRIGSDLNEELIELLCYMRDNPDMSIFPEECSFEHYADVRKARKERSGKYSVPYTAGIGYFASYGGRYFDGGYGRDPKGVRSIYKEHLNYAKKQAPLLKNISFKALPFEYYTNSAYKNCVFYLDPPYRNTKGYAKNSIDYEKFYNYCRFLANDNYVFISEFYMPDDFECIWEKERKLLQKSDREKADVAIEKLYIAKK